MRRSKSHGYRKKIFTLHATVKGKLLKKVLIGIFAFQHIQNGETDFKIESYQNKSYLGFQQPRFWPSHF